MSGLLGQNGLPAERQRGLTFVELFRNAAEVAKNGGLVGGGTPTFGNGYASFDGASYLSYPIANSSIRSGNICSFEIEATPASVAGAQILAVIGDPAGNYIYIGIVGGNWRCSVSGVVAVDSTFPAVVGQKVKFACTLGGNVGTLRTYLDGVAGATFAFAGVSQTISTPQIALGGFGGANYYTGQIHSFRAFRAELSPEEVLQYATNNVFSYRSRATISLPMGNAQHTATATLDTSGNGRNGGFSATAPTKRVGVHGYTTNGATQWFTSTVSNVFNTAGITFAMEFAPSYRYDDGADHVLYDTTGAARFLVYKTAANSLTVQANGAGIANIAGATFGPFWMQNARNVLITSFQSAATCKSNVWVNDGWVLQDNANAWAAGNPDTLYIGVSNGGALPHPGMITRFASWPVALTPIQVYDYLALLQRTASEV